MVIQPKTFDHRKPIFIQPGEAKPGRWINWRRGPLFQKPGYQAWRKPTSCPTEDCGGYAGYLDLPICESCAWKAWAVLNANKDAERERDRMEKLYQAYLDEEHGKHEVQTLVTEDPEDTLRRYNPGHIYYLLVGDLIKIGYTADLEQRMKNYPPNSQLLAGHPGTIKTERQMHSKFFNHLAKGREWFAVHEELISHIEESRSRFKKYPVVDSLNCLKVPA